MGTSRQGISKQVRQKITLENAKIKLGGKICHYLGIETGWK